MSDGERENLKEQLRAIVAGLGDGIDLDTPFHWVVKDLQHPVSFFEHLPTLLPSGSIFYMEGIDIAPEIASFYSANRASNPVDVIRDTIYPVPDTYHVSFSPDVCARLRKFAECHASTELFDHINAYKGESLLFTFHDAFSGWLLASEHVLETSLAESCQKLGVSFRREKTLRREPEQLRRFLWIMEHPDQLKIHGESLFARMRRWLTRNK